jgi:hypothetical protein
MLRLLRLRRSLVRQAPGVPLGGSPSDMTASASRVAGELAALAADARSCGRVSFFLRGCDFSSRAVFFVQTLTHQCKHRPNL